MVQIENQSTKREFYKSYLILVQELFQKSEPNIIRPNIGAIRKRNLVAATVFLAFAMESFINDFGNQFFEEFDDFEMTPTYKKYLLFPKYASSNPFPLILSGSNKYRLLRALFKYRDLFVHHKPKFREEESREEVMFNELNHEKLREFYSNCIKIFKLFNSQFHMFTDSDDWLTDYSENL
ncbi:MAG: hypothetical protein WAV30_00585 [Microgenomates group bacterium]